MKSLEHSFIIQQNIHFSSAHGTHFSLHYSGVLPAVKTSHSPVCQYHSTLYTKWEDCNHSTVSVSVSIIKQWLAVAQWTGMDVEVVTACLKYYCNICLKGQKKAMKICQASWCHRKDSNQVIPSEPIPSVGLHIIFHHHYQNKCLIYIPVYVSMYIL